MIKSLAAGVAGAALAVAVAGACAGEMPPPPLERMAADVARLGEVVPIVMELHATDFEDSPQCTNLAYERGAFGHLDEDGCERDGTVEFDAQALDAHARVAQAIAASGVAATRMRSATYAPNGDLETAWFVLEGSPLLDAWEYLYDPSGSVPKEDVAGRIDFTPLVADWWFVVTPDD